MPNPFAFIGPRNQFAADFDSFRHLVNADEAAPRGAWPQIRTHVTARRDVGGSWMLRRIYVSLQRNEPEFDARTLVYQPGRIRLRQFVFPQDKYLTTLSSV